MPSTSPTTSARHRALKVSSRVKRTRGRITSKTGSSVNRERPKSPVAARPSHLPYWTGSGSLRPRVWRSRTMSCAVASGPARIRAGSLTPYNSPKVVSDRINVTSTAWIRRWTT